MNIVFITSEFVSEGEFGGGLATYLNNITAIMSNAGHNVTVITASKSNESIEWNGITVERVNVKRWRWGKPYPWKEALALSYELNKRLRTLVRAGKKIDVVQYANYNALALFRTRIPTVVRVSSDSLLWRKGNCEDFDVAGIYKCEKILDYLEDLALKKSDIAFGPSKVIADIISARTNKTIEVVESPFFQTEYRTAASPFYDVVKNKKYVITYGQLSIIKGIKTVGEAIYDILSMHNDLYYIFAGTSQPISVNGKTYSAIEYLVTCAKEHADRIIYFGCLPRNHLYSIIRGAKAVILPSRIDNLPNTCIEAMYLGKIVIGTEKASFEQLINSGKSGYLINRDAPSELVDAVEQVLELSEDEAAIIGENAQKRIRQMSAENVLEKTIDLYNKAINGRNNGDY